MPDDESLQGEGLKVNERKLKYFEGFETFETIEERGRVPISILVYGLLYSAYIEWGLLGSWDG